MRTRRTVGRGDGELLGEGEVGEEDEEEAEEEPHADVLLRRAPQALHQLGAMVVPHRSISPPISSSSSPSRE